MEAYQQRVVDERDALQLKRINLGNFLRGVMFQKMQGTHEGSLLERQFHTMLAYEEILDERIALFPVAPVAVEKKTEV